MNRLWRRCQRKLVALLMILLGVANLITWGSKAAMGQKPDNLYSAGITFGADGTQLNFINKLEFRANDFIFSSKYSWNDKNNTLIESGNAKYGLWGQLELAVTNSSSFGQPLLTELEIDEDFLFGRAYMQSGQAIISLVPLSTDFEGTCFYLTFARRVYCGARETNALPLSQTDNRPAVLANTILR